MEHTQHAAVVPTDIGWNDIGAWSALWDVGAKDANGNVLRDDVYLDGVENSLVRAESRMVAAIGVSNLLIVETADAVLVADKNRAQDVKKVVDYLKASRPQRTRIPHPRVPSLGLVRRHRRRRTVPGQTDHSEAGRETVIEDAPSPRRTLGGGLRHGAGNARRGGRTAG